jgi:hypothetical protein
MRIFSRNPVPEAMSISFQAGFRPCGESQDLCFVLEHDRSVESAGFLIFAGNRVCSEMKILSAA